jgi:iron complex outermembrane receptor protein
MSVFWKRAFVCALALAPTPAFAQELSLNDSPTNIVVLGRRIPPSQQQAAEEMAQIPGGVDLVPFEDFANRYAVSFADTLRLSPGVIADPRFAEEVRLSVRGSGLSRGFHMRGLDLSVDGAPINISDGAGDFQEIDPLSAQRIEVFRGANGLRFGSASLGGAVNLATPTGRDVDAPLAVRLEAGSFNTTRENVRFAAAGDKLDLFGAVTHSESDGFRDHDDGDSTRLALNGGMRSAWGKTRASLFLSEINQHLPGSITLQQALNDPSQAAAGAANNGGDQARDIRSTRAIISHNADLGFAHLDAGVWSFSKSLYHPIFQLFEQDSFDWGVYARLSDEDRVRFVRRWTIGASFARGDNDARQYVNRSGSQGDLKQHASQDAETDKVYGEVELGLSDRLSGIVGVQGIRSERLYDRTFPDTLHGERTFVGVNPKFGFLYQASDSVTLYGNISRSYEPPTFTEYVQAPFGSFVSTIQPVDAQSAWTGEIGARGEAGPLTFDVAIYRANVRDEMLQFSDPDDPLHPAATFNAGDTIHQGVEAYVQWRALQNDAGRLTATAAYTFSDFRFDNDPVYRNNRLAGAPRHQIHGEISWRSAQGWHVTPNLNWIPEDVDVDYTNTTKAPGYTVWGLEAGYDLPNGVTLFLDARNLTDENYIATFSTATMANVNSALYYPGETRSVYVGATFRFGAE